MLKSVKIWTANGTEEELKIRPRLTPSTGRLYTTLNYIFLNLFIFNDIKNKHLLQDVIKRCGDDSRMCLSSSIEDNHSFGNKGVKDGQPDYVATQTLFYLLLKRRQYLRWITRFLTCVVCGSIRRIRDRS